MRIRTVAMLGAAALLGITAIYIAHAPGAPGREAPTKKVVVAGAELEFGMTLNDRNLREIAWPAQSVPAGAFSSIKDLTGPEPRVALRTIEPGEVILPGQVTGPGGRATLSTVIQHGMRAVAIKVNEVLGVAGFVQPDDRVDVMLTRQEQGKGATSVLLQDVKVLAVDQEASDKRDKPIVARAVTLEVTPEQAEKLTLAAQVGTLSLSLRADGNGGTAPARVVRLADLEGGGPAKPGAAPRQRGGSVTIDVIRGLAESAVDVPPARR